METNKQSLSGLKKEDFKKVINGKEVDPTKPIKPIKGETFNIEVTLAN